MMQSFMMSGLMIMVQMAMITACTQINIQCRGALSIGIMLEDPGCHQWCSLVNQKLYGICFNAALEFCSALNSGPTVQCLKGAFMQSLAGLLWAHTTV